MRREDVFNHWFFAAVVRECTFSGGRVALWRGERGAVLSRDEKRFALLRCHAEIAMLAQVVPGGAISVRIVQRDHEGQEGQGQWLPLWICAGASMSYCGAAEAEDVERLCRSPPC